MTTSQTTVEEKFGGTGRSFAVGFSIGTKGYIGTGWDSSTPLTRDFWEYDPDANAWTRKADFGGAARNFAVGFSIGTKGYIGTGWNNGSSIYKDFWEYSTYPYPFIFTDQTGVALNTVITSNTITVSGITEAVSISITGGEYSVSTDSGLNWSDYSSTTPATVSLNHQVRVQQTSSASYSTMTNTTLTIGGVSDTFSVTTLDETIPDLLTVTYNGNTNTGGSVPTDGNTYHITDTVTVLGNTGSLVKTGYTFAGWNTAANGSGTSYSPGNTFAMGSSNVMLYAQWTLNTYEVTYNANGATSGTPPAGQIKTHGVDLILETNSGNLVKTGYTFAGWNTATDGTGTAYAEGGTYTVNEAVTLYARWTPISTDPVIQVTPNSLNFGYVPVGSTKDLPLKVKNTGTEVLTGNATTAAPFSIVSSGNYNLVAGQEQVVSVQYQPTSSGKHTGMVSFTGGNGAMIPLTGKTEKSQSLPWLQLLLGE